MGRETFILYTDINSMVKKLDNERKGILFQTILDYVETGESPDDLDLAVDVAFARIKDKLDENNEKWEEQRQKRVIAGREGGKAKARNKKQKLASASKCYQTLASSSNSKQNLPVTVTVPVTVTDTVTDTDTVTNINPSIVSPVRGTEERFNEFWQAYPNKKAKKNAWKAWNKIKPDEDLFDRIMDALEIAKRSPDWTKDKGQYVPHPATWLNAERWNDEYQVAENESSADFFLAIAQGGS